MNKTLQEGIELAKEVNNKVKDADIKNVTVVIGTLLYIWQKSIK